MYDSLPLSTPMMTVYRGTVWITDAAPVHGLYVTWTHEAGRGGAGGRAGRVHGVGQGYRGAHLHAHT